MTLGHFKVSLKRTQGPLKQNKKTNILPSVERPRSDFVVPVCIANSLRMSLQRAKLPLNEKYSLF